MSLIRWSAFDDPFALAEAVIGNALGPRAEQNVWAPRVDVFETPEAVRLEGEPLVLTDTPASDPSKATVYFYNLSDLASVDLFVPAAKTKAIEGIEGDTTKSVALKAPLTLDFEVQAEYPGRNPRKRTCSCYSFRTYGVPEPAPSCFVRA